ncbi:hypothetical protein GGX14DRAFT_397171 [Mycena pura]|uniref:Uncharacterized protein n=1 Tax=Mycena pura TaxID=153505 RepID=A0AAD6VCZ6_9AGAR|nr:hypothetical protein GGX14DRAFT_397171 [Mycena pura]
MHKRVREREITRQYGKKREKNAKKKRICDIPDSARHPDISPGSGGTRPDIGWQGLGNFLIQLQLRFSGVLRTHGHLDSDEAFCLWHAECLKNARTSPKTRAQNAKFGLGTRFDGLEEPVGEIRTAEALRMMPFGKSGPWAPQARPDRGGGPGERVPHLLGPDRVVWLISQT